MYLRTFNYLKSFPVPAKAGRLGQSDKKWHCPSSTEILFLEYKLTSTMAGVKVDLILTVLALWCVTRYIVSCTGSLKDGGEKNCSCDYGSALQKWRILGLSMSGKKDKS